MKLFLITLLTCCSLPVFAETGAAPLTVNDVIAHYSQQHNVKILAPNIDSPVHLYGMTLSDLDYGDLLAILEPYEYSAIKNNDLVIIKHKKALRSSVTTRYEAGKNYYNDEFITTILTPINVCSTSIITKLRPLVQQHAFVAADAASNSIWLTETYANTMRIKGLLEEIDSKTPKQKNCGPKNEE